MKYIGKQITILSIKDYIVDNGLTDKAILLNSKNFDDVVLEYKEFYNESMSVPYNLLGILITEDYTKTVPYNRVGIIDSDDLECQNYCFEENYDLYDDEKAYRCGFCGGIVDKNGNELYGEERSRIIQYIEKFENSIVNKTHGYCCKEEWQ
ncbi:hypothetical protein [Flavobacterium sp.]|uniref:hypothetical protein n=1 Tax=Flavobacterium sp. TaxID=239 RepID=UPI003752EB97